MVAERLRSVIFVVLAVMLAPLLIQCSPKTQIIKESDETVLRRRVEEYWGYKIKGEWSKSYLYESSDFRKGMTIEGYITQYGRSVVKWERFDILEVWASGEEGHAKVNATYRFIIPQTRKAVVSRVVQEQWMKNEGQWFHASSS